MGNLRFRMSNMMPNVWFYKLKDMSKRSRTRRSSHKHHISHYHFTREATWRTNMFHASPVPSDTHFPDNYASTRTKRTPRKTVYKPSPTKLVSPSARGSYTSISTLDNSGFVQESSDYSLSDHESSSVSENGDDDYDDQPQLLDDQLPPWSLFSDFKLRSSSTDIIIDMCDISHASEFEVIIRMSEQDFHPVFTKPTKSSRRGKSFKKRSVPTKMEKDRVLPEQSSLRRKSSGGIRLRVCSPKIASKKIQACARKSMSFSSTNTYKSQEIPNSFAIIKSSVDPQNDFRDSMVEMIVENNIREIKELEDLLACFLSLNSTEYHDVIIKAFEQIWIDMTSNLL